MDATLRDRHSQYSYQVDGEPARSRQDSRGEGGAVTLHDGAEVDRERSCWFADVLWVAGWLGEVFLPADEQEEGAANTAAF